MWHELSKLAVLHLPWLIFGDFSAILANHEHKGGTFSYYIHKFQGFLDFVERNNLLELKNSGSHFTWFNNQAGTARRWNRLDRCLVNMEWNSFFNSYNLKHLNRAFSTIPPFFYSLVCNLLRNTCFLSLRIFGLIMLVIIP